MTILSCPALVEAEGENGHIKYKKIHWATPETTPSWIGQLYRISSLA